MRPRFVAWGEQKRPFSGKFPRSVVTSEQYFYCIVFVCEGKSTGKLHVYKKEPLKTITASPISSFGKTMMSGWGPRDRAV